MRRFESVEAIRDKLCGMVVKESMRLSEEHKLKDMGSVAWVLIGYDEKQPNVMKMVASGYEDALRPSTGSPGYLKYFTSDSIFFIAHRTLFVPEHQKGASDQYAQPYYGLIRWLGENVEVMQKALSSHHWNAFSELVRSCLSNEDAVLQPGHFLLSDVSDLTAEALSKYMKLQ